ncbi:Csu type fimbrial protein [Serratia sp. BFP-2025]|uniref:Csu type fimbrial protein n=1 Tax=Serratia TaxID=613 RepID=UPI0012B777D6|nr:spore coat U domain-containing protein [Serratia surfactantfaciens]MTD09807.1 fimbrial major subunit CsuA/B family protein [Serratia sp. YC16]
MVINGTLRTLLLTALIGAPAAHADTVSQGFTVNASIIKGCVLGSGVTNVTSFGSMSFGQVASLSSPIKIVSSAGAGSILIRCNPGLSVSLALNVGNNVTGSIASGRKLLNSATSETLVYQLYQDTNYTVLWGDGGNGGAVQTVSSTGSTQEIKIYASLMASSTLPTSGTYNDTVLVTVSY